MRPGKGVRVIRGLDWCHGSQDGGPGHLGTVQEVSYEKQTCSVRWDVGTVTKNCRANEHEQDLRIVDTSHPELENNLHESVSCDGENCKTSGYRGQRWKCVECTDFDLCTSCYMAGQHDKTHHFIRFDSTIAIVVPVPPRKTSKRMKVYSMEPKSQVRHIKQKTKGAEEPGTVIEVINKTPLDSIVKVEWASGETTQHEISQEKKSDLVIVHSTGYIYPDHLPLADLSQRVETHINLGDKVVVDINIDTFRQMQKEYGGWNDEMEKLLGEIGVVVHLERAIATVQYQTLGRKWHVFVQACTKVSVIGMGDVVKLIGNEGMVKKRQHRHGGWQDTMRKELGEVGQVTHIDCSGDLFVKFKTHTHLLSPSCCVKVCEAELPVRHSEEANKSEVTPEVQLEDVTKVEVIKKEDQERKEDSQQEETVVSDIETDASCGDSVMSSLASELPDDRGICYDFPDLDFDDMVSDIGLRVVRGKDWKWENQDGGEGNVGTVVLVGNEGGSGSCPPLCAVVLWDSGYRNTYRAGYENAFDLKIFDTAPVGVRHDNVQCSECEDTDLMGFVWQCVTCKTNPVTLCHSCYHGDVHDVDHHFLRVNKPGTDGESVPTREKSRKIRTKGVFEGSRVIRGPDWRWDNQDHESEGEVIAVVNFSLDTDRDAVEVRWKDGYTNVYRYGFDGAFDVKCANKGVVECGTYFRDHLPDFKVVEQSGAGPVAPSDRISPGDAVRIGVDPEILQAIHKSEGSWNESMVDCIGKTGEVILAENDNITVKFDVGSWSFKEMALVKVKHFKKGDTVRVRDNEHEVMELQNGHGEWNQKTRKTLGKKGIVNFVDQYGDVSVKFGSMEFKFNPECLDLSQGDPDTITEERRQETTPEPDDTLPKKTVGSRNLERQLKEATAEGDAVTVESILQQQNNLLRSVHAEPPLIHVACQKGHSDVVRVFVKYKADLEVVNDGNSKCTPLMTAVANKQIQVVRVLLRAKVKKDARNSNGQTVLHLAVQTEDVELLDVLQDCGFDINQADNLGDCPINDAITTGNKQVVTQILNWPNINFDFTNSLGFSPLHVAARKGNDEAVEIILKRNPELLNRAKEVDGFTALHLAACQNHARVVQVILRKPKVKTEMRTLDGGWTPLHIACMYQSKDTVEMLISKDGQSLVQLDSEDNERNNALHLCLNPLDTSQKQGTEEDTTTRYEIAKMLIDQGIHYNTKNSHGKTALEECVNEDLQRMVRKLLQEKDVRQKQRNVAPTPKVCLSCSEDPANYILQPCQCYICNECGAKKAKLCPNCSSEVKDRKKIMVG